MKSSDGGLDFPRLFVSDHGIEDGQELSHAGDEGDLFPFASGQEFLVMGFDGEVVPGRHERGHVEGVSDGGSSAANAACPARLAAVVVERRESHQRRDALARRAKRGQGKRR